MKSELDQTSQPKSTPFRINRRVHYRYLMVRRDGFIHVGGDKVPCVVSNISSGGLMARVYRRVELDECVRIELAGGHLVEGTILWARDWEVGLAFSEPLDVEAILAEQWVTEGAGDRRRTHRANVKCPATLKVGSRYYFGRLCDLSPTGAKVQTRGRLKKVADTILSLPDLPPLAATLRWINGRECGLAFKEHIPADALSRWLRDRGISPPR